MQAILEQSKFIRSSKRIFLLLFLHTGQQALGVSVRRDPAWHLGMVQDLRLQVAERAKPTKQTSSTEKTNLDIVLSFLDCKKTKLEASVGF
jgi:hypothetical protein